MDVTGTTSTTGKVDSSALVSTSRLTASQTAGNCDTPPNGMVLSHPIETVDSKGVFAVKTTKETRYVLNRAELLRSSNFRNVSKIVTGEAALIQNGILEVNGKSLPFEGGNFEVIGILPGTMINEAVTKTISQEIYGAPNGIERTKQLARNKLAGPILASKVVCKLTLKEGGTCLVLIPAAYYM